MQVPTITNGHAMPTPDLFRLNVIWQNNSADAAVNVLHFDLTEGTPLGLSEQGLADVFADAVATQTNLLTTGGSGALMANEWSVDRITLRDMRIPNQPEYSSAVGVTGTGTSSPLPAANAVCVTLRTPLAGRSFRGRCYVPGWASNAVTTAGAIAVGARERAEDWVSGIAPLVETSVPGVQLVVYSRTLDETNPVTQVVTRDDQWDVQRRRNVPGI